MFPINIWRRYVSAQVKHDFIIWEGYCPTHAKILPENIMQAKRLHPKAKVIVHPECRPEVTALADVVTSTEGMSKYIKKAPETEFIIGTETGIIHRMKKENPDKIFLSGDRNGSLSQYEKNYFGKSSLVT